jgi:GT2 family glycosyltransferase
MSNPGLPTVILPVYNAFEQLQNCLQSLKSTLDDHARVLIIDDASDDSRVPAMLQHYVDSTQTTWKLDFQTENIGFVGTVNRGMKMTDGDVVLLNSDTIVTSGWLEGLQVCLASDAMIATATPWTNNGEIASLPKFCKANPVPSDPEAVAGLIHATGRPRYPEIPTAVGFCMGISRHAINALGVFDQQLFGLGYGEENDFSMRAINAGMRNVLCDDVYVAHVGGASFLPRGLQPDASAMSRLLSRHPDYLEKVEAFIKSDPLSERRTQLVSRLQSAGIELA